MQLERAQKLAQEIVEQIRPYCERIEVAGSIRRKKSEVRDVDIVLIPKPSLWRRIIATLQGAMGAKILKRGDSIAQVTIRDVNVDLYVASEHSWGVLLLIRTGSAEHNIKLSQVALRKGMSLTHKGLIKGGKVIASTEKEIFEALDLPYVEPELRG
jgi:DNA polymerase (family 10)